MLQLEAPRTKFARWAIAFGLVAAVHGGALAFVLRPEPVDDWESQAGGAFIIELSPITASPSEENHEIAVGEKSAEIAPVAASAPQVASVAEPVPVDEPILPETTEPPPDDAVAKRPEEKLPEEEKPPEESAAQAEDAPAVAPVAASEAAAPQKIENATETSDVPKGANVGLSRVDRQAIQNWQRDLVVHINKKKRYPAKAREARQHGIVTVAFTMDRKGQLVRVAIFKGAGYEALDEAAIDMLKRANPLPTPPDAMVGETFEFVVPVRFRWKD
ncbi:MAG: energy transducer TonB [Hyphomicrobiaceae bacterium]